MSKQQTQPKDLFIGEITLLDLMSMSKQSLEVVKEYLEEN